MSEDTPKVPYWKTEEYRQRFMAIYFPGETALPVQFGLLLTKEEMGMEDNFDKTNLSDSLEYEKGRLAQRESAETAGLEKSA